MYETPRNKQCTGGRNKAGQENDMAKSESVAPPTSPPPGGIQGGLPAGHTPVRCIREIRENGVIRRPGDAWPMENSLVEPHVAAGVVERT